MDKFLVAANLAEIIRDKKIIIVNEDDNSAELTIMLGKKKFTISVKEI